MSEKICFIVCPISDDGSEIRKRSDQLMKHIIEPICKEFSLTPIRIDKLPHNGSITEEILNYLKNSALVISDITDHNPNCFYESGFRNAIGKPLIFVKNKGVSIPFDISTIRTLEYNLTDLDEVEKLKQALKDTIGTLDFDSNTSSIKNDTSSETNNKILTLLLNLENKIDRFNSEIVSTITETMSEKIIASSRPKNDNEIFLDLFKTILLNPQSLEALIELSKKEQSI